MANLAIFITAAILLFGLSPLAFIVSYVLGWIAVGVSAIVFGIWCTNWYIQREEARNQEAYGKPSKKLGIQNGRIVRRTKPSLLDKNTGRPHH